MNDIKKPKKTTATGTAQRLVVEHRPIIGHDLKKSVPIRDAADDPASPSAAEVRHIAAQPIKPLSPSSTFKATAVASAGPMPEQPAPGLEENAEDPILEKEPELATPVVSTSPTIQPPKAKAAESASAPTPPPTPTATAPAPPPGTPAAPDSAATSVADPAGSKESAETRKAVEAATKAAKREKELEEMIDERKFYVPIKTSARKRSIKVSFGLTFLILLLAVMLIDLMLDSDTILLLQKIPHTHFFTTTNTN